MNTKNGLVLLLGSPCVLPEVFNMDLSCVMYYC